MISIAIYTEDTEEVFTNLIDLLCKDKITNYGNPNTHAIQIPPVNVTQWIFIYIEDDCCKLVNLDVDFWYAKLDIAEILLSRKAARTDGIRLENWIDVTKIISILRRESD